MVAGGGGGLSSTVSEARLTISLRLIRRGRDLIIISDALISMIHC